MEEKKMTVKEQREISLIIENLELIKVLMRVFQGQVLQSDLRDFCLNFRVFDTGEAFGYAVEKLIKNKVLKKTTYPNTTYVVILAKACVNKYVNNNDDSIDFSSSLVRLNCFKNAMICKTLRRPECTIDKFIELIKQNTTFLNSKYDTESAYNFFNKYLKLNETADKSFRCARYRNSKGLKYIETIGSEKDDLLSFVNSFDTFVNKNIYTFYSNNKFKFYILDVNDNLNAEKVGKKIATVIGTLYEQVEQLSLLDKLDKVEFIVISRDKVRRDKIINAFRKTYYKEHMFTSAEDSSKAGQVVMIKAYQEHLLNATNTALKNRVSNIKVNYIDRNKESKDIFSFRNSFTQYGLNINIKVMNANLNDRINMYTRISNVKLGRKTKHEKELEKKIRRKIEMEISKEIESKYIAIENEIRRQILAEYNLPSLEDLDED